MPENFISDSLAIAGSEDIVLGFKSLGFKIYALKDIQDFEGVIADIVERNIAVCLLQEDIYEGSRGALNRYRKLTRPVFIPFSRGDKTKLLDSIIKDVRLKATGVV